MRSPHLSTRLLGSSLLLFALASSAKSQSNDHLVHLGESAPGTVTVTFTNSVYHLKFVGDELLDYQLDMTAHPLSRGYLRVYEASSDCWPIFDGGAGYRRADGLATGPSYLAQFTTLTNHFKTADSVVMEYQDNADGGSHHRRYTYTLRGKSLSIHVEDMDGNTSYLGNFCGLLVNPTVGTESPSYLKVQGALATPMFSFLHGTQRWYFGEMLDMPSSNAADYFLDMDPIVAGTTSVQANMNTITAYKRLSNGQVCAPLKDTISITLSTRLRDVLVTPTQPASPYCHLLRNRLMLNLPGTDWSGGYAALWTWAQQMGLDDIAGYFFAQWSASAPDLPNGDNVGPDWAPAINASAFGPMVQSGAAKGYLLGAYTAFNTMPPTAPAGIFNAAHEARNDLSSPKLSVQTGLPMIAISASGIHAARESTLAKQNYGLNMSYLDIQTYASPSKGADGDHIDQIWNSGYANTLARAISDQKTWMSAMSDTSEGPLVGEGSIATKDSEMEWLWAGYCDSVQRVINTDTAQHANQMPAGDPGSPTLWPLNPEFELRVMSRLQANHGNGIPDRFFSRSDGPGFVNMSTGNPIFPMNEAMLDRYRAYEISYGKTGYIQCNGPFANGVGNYTFLADVLKEYYLMTELQARYFEAPVSAIEYFDAGQYKTVEQMLAPTGSSDVLIHPQLRLRWSNGLDVYVNHKTTAWAVTVNGTSYTIPQDGFVAAQQGTSYVAFSAIAPTTGGQRIDYCFAPGRYEFFDGRGQVNGYGGIDTAGQKRLRVRNDVHATTVWEGANDVLNVIQGTPPVPVQIDVLPATTILPLGSRVGLRAIATYSNGSYRDVTTLVNWTSTAPNAVRINEGAAITAVGHGRARITCTSLGGAQVIRAGVLVP